MQKWSRKTPKWSLHSFGDAFEFGCIKTTRIAVSSKLNEFDEMVGKTLLYRVLRERSAKQYQLNSTTQKNKKNLVKLVAILEIEGATGSWNMQIYKNL